MEFLGGGYIMFENNIKRYEKMFAVTSFNVQEFTNQVTEDLLVIQKSGLQAEIDYKPVVVGGTIVYTAVILGYKILGGK